MNETTPDEASNYNEVGERNVLSMFATRTVEYKVEHTDVPVFDVSNSCLASAVNGSPVILVVDELLWPKFGAQIERYAQVNLDCVALKTLPGSEWTKSVDEVVTLCRLAFDVNLPRHGAFIAIGGGTILDLVGFAASIYRRGIGYVRVPTTLIGMIDVGVGIKQAINFNDKKNAIGSFYPPLRTINDIGFLYGLPKRELISGVAEALKVGLVCDSVIFELLEAYAFALVSSGFREPKNIAVSVLLRAEAAMMQQLRENLYERDLRRFMDFGHSFSPLLETTSNYEILHGEAVALDMLLSTMLGVGRKLCDPALATRLAQLYRDVGLPVTHALMSPLLMERALVDARAHRGGALNLVVPTGLGSADFLQDVSYDDIVVAIAAISEF